MKLGGGELLPEPALAVLREPDARQTFQEGHLPQVQKNEGLQRLLCSIELSGFCLDWRAKKEARINRHQGLLSLTATLLQEKEGQPVAPQSESGLEMLNMMQKEKQKERQTGKSEQPQSHQQSPAWHHCGLKLSECLP
jgi:hypothetical protein